MRAGIVATATLLCQMSAALAAETPSSPPSGGSGQPGESLSEKLSKGQGVIKPAPDIDPRITKPAPEPNPNTTPVLPPPSPNAK
jgi:hypothetical protein